MRRGDLVEVVWVDITEDSGGDPSKAALTVRHSAGYFWDRCKSHGLDCVVTTLTHDEVPTEAGWCIFPKACVRSIRVVKRA